MSGRIQERHEASAGIGVGARTRVRAGIGTGTGGVGRGDRGGVDCRGAVELLLRVVEERVMVEWRGGRGIGEGAGERRRGVGGRRRERRPRGDAGVGRLEENLCVVVPGGVGAPGGGCHRRRRRRALGFQGGVSSIVRRCGRAAEG